MSAIQEVHRQYVHSRRVRVLSRRLASLIKPPATVLDVGCGDGLLAHSICQQVPGVSIEGVDVLVRGTTVIPVHPFDGDVIPHENASFDYVMLVDVLHHTDDPLRLLREATRVARRAVLVKDHLTSGMLAVPTLRLMDWVGNAAYGVRLPFNYWSLSQWNSAFDELIVAVDHWETDLRMYPRPADFVFGRSLHFIARLISKDSP